MGLRETLRPLRQLWHHVTDPRRNDERSGQRVAFLRLKAEGFLDGLEGKRFLEIGPKHGGDSRLLADLKPGRFILLDLPEKDPMVREWLPEVSTRCPTTFIEGNLLYLSEAQHHEIGQADLIWCLGVLYHNVEQVRLIKRLYDLCAVHGRVVIESATTRNPSLEGLNVVEIHWPKTYRDVQTITHLPSRLAIKSWMEMVGFVDVQVRDVYSRSTGWQRAVLTGVKPEKAQPYIGYSGTGLNPVYETGSAE